MRYRESPSLPALSLRSFRVPLQSADMAGEPRGRHQPAARSRCCSSPAAPSGSPTPPRHPELLPAACERGRAAPTSLPAQPPLPCHLLTASTGSRAGRSRSRALLAEAARQRGWNAAGNISVCAAVAASGAAREYPTAEWTRHPITATYKSRFCRWETDPANPPFNPFTSTATH